MPAPSGSDIWAITDEICEFGLARRSDVGGSLRYKGSIGELIYVPYTSWAASYIGNRRMNHSTMAHLVLKFHMAHDI
jgi:hypothetical protein